MLSNLQEKRKGALVSIIMPTYKRAEFLEKTIDSILSQTYSNFELVIVCDPSTDNTFDILTQIATKDDRIKVIHNETRMRHISSLNIGLRAAQGVYIARADDDDPWIDKNKLSKQINFLKTHRDYVAVGTGAIVIDEKNRELFRYLQPNDDHGIREKMLLGNPFINSTMVLRQSALLSSGFYDENLKDVEDWDLWLRVGKVGKLYNLQTYDILRFYGRRGLSVKNRLSVGRTRFFLVNKYRKDYPHFIKALIFNGLQFIYTLLPYIKPIDNFLFKMKRLVLMK